MKREKQSTSIEIEQPASSEPAPVDHMEEIRTLARQLTSDISPSGAQTVGNQILSHLNSLANDEGKYGGTARQLRPANRQFTQGTGQNQSGYERSPDPIKDNGEP